MFDNQNENSLSALASALKCVCETPEKMNTFAVVLASNVAQNASKEDLLKQIQFLQVLHTALRSYL
ncbi:MAG: hypothetical protein IK048_03600 [Clostridia bacterium]|nr:hypothetical protein [Clostridia bacterium]